MDLRNYFTEMKNIQENILEYFNNEEKTEEDFINLEFLKQQKLGNHKDLLKETLLMLSSIVNNHHHTKNFYEKIFAILKALKKPINVYLTSYDLFWIFKNNKRLVLFLLDEKLLKPSDPITNILSNCKYYTHYYQEYFFSEIGSKRIDKLPFFDIVGVNYWPSSIPNFPIIDYTKFYETLLKDHESDIINGDGYNKKGFFKEPKSSDALKQYEQKRRIGENDNEIARLIQNDLIDDFISHVTENNVDLNSKIKSSIYETNNFLFGKKPTLMQYSMFWGSRQIIDYLCKNNVKLDSSLWLYAIHGRRADLIELLVEKKIKPENDDYLLCYLESIKCHHNNIAIYIKNQLLQTIKKSDECKIEKCLLKYHNYSLFPKNINEKVELFYEFCKYGYTEIFDFLLQTAKVDVNKPVEFEKKINFNFKRTTTPLNAAVSHNNYEIVETLLSLPSIDANSKWTQVLNEKKDNRHYKTEKTPLIIAVEKENVMMTELLLTNSKIDLNADRYLKHHFFSYTFEEAKNALSISIINRNKEIFEMLLKHPRIDVNREIFFGCDLSENNKHQRKETPLILTIDFELTDYFQLLLQHPKIDVNAFSGYTEYGKRDYGHDDFDNYCEFTEISALNLVIKRKKIEMAKLLLKHPKINVNLKSNPQLNEETPLLASFRNGTLEIFKLLLQHPSIDVNVINEGMLDSNKTVLQAAFGKWDTRAIKLLLKKKDINVNLALTEEFDQNKMPDHFKNIKTKGNEESLLIRAIEKEDVEIVDLLLKRNQINVNYLNTKITIKRNIDKKSISETDSIVMEKKTALMIAAEKNNAQIVRLLLADPKIKVDIKTNVTTIEQKYGSKNGKDGGGWVLKNETKNSQIETALLIAQRNGNKEIADLLHHK